MSPRAYLLLDITNGNYRRVIQTLKGKPGVTMVDMLQGPPDILVMVEAHNRHCQPVHETHYAGVGD